MIHRPVSLAIVAGALAVAQPLRAQSGNPVVTQALRAYRSMEYDVAALMLRHGLDATGPDTLPLGERADAYVYLGATELFLGRRDSAAAAFRRALAIDPRYRPHRLTFPPEVTSLFDAARLGTAYLRLDGPTDTTIVPGEKDYVVRLYASAPLEVTVDLGSANGRPLRHLYAGPVSDSLDVHWDGLGADRLTPVDGSLVLEAKTMRSSGSTPTVRMPLVAQRVGGDARPDPPMPDSLLLPERVPAGPGLRALAGGVLTGLAAVVLPSLVARGSPATPARLAVGGALGLAGVVGLIRQRPGGTISANIATNRATREAWKLRIDQTRAENRASSAPRRVRITTDQPVSLSQERP